MVDLATNIYLALIQTVRRLAESLDRIHAAHRVGRGAQILLLLGGPLR